LVKLARLDQTYNLALAGGAN